LQLALVEVEVDGDAALVVVKVWEFLCGSVETQEVEEQDQCCYH